MRWIYLILASCCEIAWFYCIGYLNKLTFRELYTFSFLQKEDVYLTIVAIVGYILFGIANMLLFMKAIQKIPASIAFSIWTGVALVGITIIDGLFLNINLTIQQIGSIALIIVGVIGLKRYGNT
jgi:quaternary ammonium compound-resistance protein SugE